ncbi:hypothetical protein AZI85_04635 [Bdellovibrio bacteriovorus]|uniref:Peptidase C1A papain C-terminal domain-containing protein n=1 Tax=Bdellovibrio bacteriovorus TaxID=959 RepID=A0A150WI27_BDEBC|nr:hypothetical protein [Bdellovibrio bacteriovorus]KYG63323.1 hypothetical protein AZI85_04635 [Bdellovibrio bacteriovorus]
MNVMGILLILAMASTAYAGENCSTVDYRKELGPNRDQGELSWCFAYTSADLISQRVKTRVSATDIASTFILADPYKLEESTQPEVKNYLQENPEIYTRLQGIRLASAGKYDPEHILRKEGLMDTGGQEDAAIILANTKGMCTEKNFPSTESHQTKFFSQITKLYKKRNEAHVKQNNCGLFQSQADFTSAVVDPFSVAITSVYEDERDRRCQRKPWPVPLVPVMTKFGDSLEEYETRIKKGEINKDDGAKKLFATIDHALENGRIAGIGYNAYSLMAPEEGEDNKHGDHSSVIAARKMIAGKCQYLIRNTWGSDCSIYYAKFHKRCEKGNVWVTKEELKESLYSVVYMK